MLTDACTSDSEHEAALMVAEFAVGMDVTATNDASVQTENPTLIIFMNYRPIVTSSLDSVHRPELGLI